MRWWKLYFPDGTTQSNITRQVIYTSNLQTIGSGCDSIIITTVDVGIYNISESVTICSGGSYTFPDGTTQTNITGQLVYSSTLQTAAGGCDSIVETTVDVDADLITESVSICSGGSYTFPDNTTQTNIMAGTSYTSTLQNQNGCDSVIVTNLSVDMAYDFDETVSVCSGDSYTFPDGTVQSNITSQLVYISNFRRQPVVAIVPLRQLLMWKHQSM